MAAALACAAGGAAILRVHDVRITREALEVFRAIASDRAPDSRT
jgi:dihydropteroate synthase